VLWHCWLGGRKGIRPVKNVRDGGGGHWLVWMEWRPAGWSVWSLLVWSLWCDGGSIWLQELQESSWLLSLDVFISVLHGCTSNRSECLSDCYLSVSSLVLTWEQKVLKCIKIIAYVAFNLYTVFEVRGQGHKGMGMTSEWKGVQTLNFLLVLSSSNAISCQHWKAYFSTFCNVGANKWRTKWYSKFKCHEQL